MIEKLLRTIKIGVSSLLMHKLRAVLAVLGIFIGIAVVIWLVAFAKGVSRQAQEQIRDLGATNIIVRSIKPPQQSSGEGRGGLFLEYGLTRADYERIRRSVPVIDMSVPIREYRMEFRRGDRTVEGRLVGCTAEYASLNRLNVYRGRFITDRDGNPPENVCVLSEDVATKLFPLEEPIGQSVMINSDFYTVVGVTETRDPTAGIGGSLDSQDFNTDIYIPLGTWRARIGDILFTSRSGGSEGEIIEINQITFGIDSMENVDEAAAIIRILLEKHHEDRGDVGVVVPKELLRQAELVETMFTWLSVIVGSFTLTVGGIGIMNIMLATVTERTREIGIRRALGAKRSDITFQFLVETVVLTGVGGCIGVVFGLLCEPAVPLIRDFAMAYVLSRESLEAIPSWAVQLTPEISWRSVGASLAVSIIVGLLAGLYPALRAAWMDPIEALRHE